MPMPITIRASLTRIDTDALPGLLADENCVGAKHHSPRPLRLHEVTVVDGTTVLLCGTCRDNLLTLTHLQDAQYPTGLAWPLLREFGNAIRALADE